MAPSAANVAPGTGLLLAMHQGEIISPENPQVSALDRGLLFGDGVYEVIQSYCGKLWGLERHLARFERSLTEIGIDNVDPEQIRRSVNKAFDAVGRVDCLVYFHVTRGGGPRSHAGEEIMEPQFLLLIKPAKDNSALVRDGITAISCPDLRWKRCDIKSLNLLPNVLARREARRRGADEAVFVSDGIITEAAVSSFFAVVDGQVVTRPLGPEILPGVTRQAVVLIARRLGLDVVERTVSLQQAYQADELFVTGTGDEIRSIVKLDDRPIASGRPGPIAKQIIDVFITHTRSGKTFEELQPAKA